MDQKKELFHKILEEHIGIIRKLCRGYTDTKEDCEDYEQEVCYQLWKSIENFRGESKTSTWVYRVTLNVCLYMLKKRKKVELIPTEQTELNQTLEARTTIESKNGQEEMLYSSIALLPPIDRAIIMLYLDKIEQAEIAKILGLGISNVGVRINRIKKKLKQIVDERIGKYMG